MFLPFGNLHNLLLSSYKCNPGEDKEIKECNGPDFSQLSLYTCQTVSQREKGKLLHMSILVLVPFLF